MSRFNKNFFEFVVSNFFSNTYKKLHFEYFLNFFRQMLCILRRYNYNNQHDDNAESNGYYYYHICNIFPSYDFKRRFSFSHFDINDYLYMIYIKTSKIRVLCDVLLTTVYLLNNAFRASSDG